VLLLKEQKTSYFCDIPMLSFVLPKKQNKKKHKIAESKKKKKEKK